jgi:type 1 glutamine amidotransferase
MRLALLLLFTAAVAQGAEKRVLYVTATAGFRHTDSIDASIPVMESIAKESGLQIVHTEDLSLINSDTLHTFDAVYFLCTSGELPLSDRQKTDLLDFVRGGKGFGGSHSATDTLYTWPEYGELIGGIFDGHPWVQEAAIDVEDPENPIVAHLAPSFRATEEFYQFRDFSRDRVRVLLTLDTRSINLAADGVHRTDGDFALAWIRKYGSGRVFYSAFGHFAESFQSPPLRKMLLQALLWLTGEVEADATPRSGPSAPPPSIAAARNLAGGSDAFAPGDLVSISGARLTSGSTLSAAGAPLPVRLAGAHVEVNGIPAPLFQVAPDRLLAQVPAGVTAGQNASLTVSSVNRASDATPLRIEPASPSVVAATLAGNVVVLYATGLGAADPAVKEGAAAPASPLSRTVIQPAVRINGQGAVLSFSGLAPGLVGVYQVNAIVPSGAGGRLEIVLEAAGRVSSPFVLTPAP